MSTEQTTSAGNDPYSIQIGWPVTEREADLPIHGYVIPACVIFVSSIYEAFDYMIKVQ